MKHVACCRISASTSLPKGHCCIAGQVLDLQLAVLAANLADYESGFAFPGTSMAVYLGRSDACVDGCRFQLACGSASTAAPAAFLGLTEQGRNTRCTGAWSITLLLLFLD